MKNYLFIFLGCFILGLYTPKIVSTSFLENEEVVHVFIEAFATNPAFTQMIYFAQLPKETPKIIAWHRFPKRSKIINLKDYNTVELSLPEGEGRIHQAYNIALQEVKKRYAENPKTKFVLYANYAHQLETLYPFLRFLPKENVKHIHLFEDGYGDIYKHSTLYIEGSESFNLELINELTQHLDNAHLPFDRLFQITIHKLYPTTYHLTYGSILKKQPGFKNTAYWIGNSFKDIDFSLWAKKMPQEQKNLVLKLAGFDAEEYKKSFGNQPTVLFLFGLLYQGDPRKEASLNLLRSLREGQLSFLTQDKEYKWLFKSHPSLNAISCTKEVHELYPDMVEIPAQVPFEVFILAGLKPTKTAGFSSSLFFMLEPKDVLLYIKRGKDNYLPALLKLGRLNLTQVSGIEPFLD